MPEPDQKKNCGYTINGVLKQGEKDGATAYHGNVSCMKQLFLKLYSPVTLFVEFECKNSTSHHFVYHFDIISWDIEDVSKSYSLCVTLDAASRNDYVFNLHK